MHGTGGQLQDRMGNIRPWRNFKNKKDTPTAAEARMTMMDEIDSVFDVTLAVHYLIFKLKNCANDLQVSRSLFPTLADEWRTLGVEHGVVPSGESLSDFLLSQLIISSGSSAFGVTGYITRGYAPPAHVDPADPKWTLTIRWWKSNTDSPWGSNFFYPAYRSASQGSLPGVLVFQRNGTVMIFRGECQGRVMVRCRLGSLGTKSGGIKG